MSVETKEHREPCCSKLKLFLASLSFVYFAKAFGGSYMKSSITQIERRFDIPSSLIGVIDGSFEMGNLLVIAFVSYFGAKLHRPRLIGIGCLIMAAGAFLTALPHLFQGRYVYETSLSHIPEENTTESILPCLTNTSHLGIHVQAAEENQAACEKEAGSYMWIYVFLGNMLRGIGETPVMPLGVSYLDDFAREENTAFYLAFIQTVGILGPMFGFMFGSFCAKIYVDIGSVDLESISINHKDSRWVGAWWLGFLVTGFLMLLAGIPFWFLPKSLPKQGKSPNQKKLNKEIVTKSCSDTTEEVKEQDSFLLEDNNEDHGSKPISMNAMAKDFGPSLKRLFTNKVYLLVLLTSLVAINGFIGMITFKPKYMEQVYGQSPSKAIFLIGVMNLPAVAFGVITGGFLMKRFKLSILGAARICIIASLLSFCLLLSQYFLYCDNSQVAGLTMTYQGASEVSYEQESLLSQCNMGCSCSLKHWDPVCASNGMTYASPCLAGCQTSTGIGKEMVFHNCTCMGELTEELSLSPSNRSAILGQCPRKGDCDWMFKLYMAISVMGAFVSACGATPGYIVLLRSISHDLKSLALGMQTLIVRTLGGIPPPIYFGALIDRTCLKWGSKRCGGQGACRLYDSHAFRITFLGLVYVCYGTSYLLWGVLYRQLSKRQKKLALRNQAKETALEANRNNGHATVSIIKNMDDLDRESTI
ncbi:solute carrier organic anion transporter family member 1C1 [Esox lucius]|uniref:Solute carrier organic anion transporter family member n=1 Tax=Esox lucius TaxID=8010 RepID=A0A3P8Y4D9_ESOLU|nr:solute carrier organic anion transporter family member 1C1 [Esox lucius]XP_010899062.2 solute carrier organic anion transporter family member 1C1 [Esox lucius]